MGNTRHFHKGIGSDNQAAGAFCFIELRIATQGYASMIVKKVACPLFRENCTLGLMRGGLDGCLWATLNGHETGNGGYSQGLA